MKNKLKDQGHFTLQTDERNEEEASPPRRKSKRNETEGSPRRREQQRLEEVLSTTAKLNLYRKNSNTKKEEKYTHSKSKECTLGGNEELMDPVDNHEGSERESEKRKQRPQSATTLVLGACHASPVDLPLRPKSSSKLEKARSKKTPRARQENCVKGKEKNTQATQRIYDYAHTILENVVESKEHTEFVLRYIDRSINKAFMKKPGCYVVHPETNQLTFDTERLYMELEEMFPNIKNLQRIFHRKNEWRLPRLLNKYVEIKWKALHHQEESEGEDTDENMEEKGKGERVYRYEEQTDDGKENPRDSSLDETRERSRSADGVSRSGFGVGLVKKKSIALTSDQIDELDKMSANGVAGIDQVKYIRRHMIE